MSRKGKGREGKIRFFAKEQKCFGKERGKGKKKHRLHRTNEEPTSSNDALHTSGYVPRLMKEKEERRKRKEERRKKKEEERRKKKKEERRKKRI